MLQLISFSFVGAFLAAVMFMPVPASAGPAGIVGYSADASLVQNVGYYKRRRWWRRDYDDYDDDYDGETHVRAPTTSVDTGPGGTDVEAPFTSVRTGRFGTWVRAPFVDLFVPR